MVDDQNLVHAVYKKLLTLYPQGFGEQLGESMQQNFDDLYKERKQQTGRGLFSFVFWVLAETGMEIIQEHILLLTQGNSMKTILANPRSAAITSFILSLPFGLTFIAFMFDIGPLVKPLNNLFTIEAGRET